MAATASPSRGSTGSTTPPARAARADKLSSDVAEYLAQAEAAHDEDRHAAAAHLLKQAKGKAQGLQDSTLVAKIADLIEWQEGLVGF